MVTDLLLAGHLFALSGLLGGIVLAVVLALTGPDRVSAREAARLVVVRLPLVFASAVVLGLVLFALGRPGLPREGGFELPGWIAIVVFVLVGHIGLLGATRHLERGRAWLWSAGMALAVIVAIGLLHASSPITGRGPLVDHGTFPWQIDGSVALRVAFVAAAGLTVAGACLPVIARRPAAVHVADLLVSRGTVAVIVGVVVQAWLGWHILENSGLSLASAGFGAWFLAASSISVLAGILLAASGRVPFVLSRALVGAAAATVAAAVVVRGAIDGVDRLPTVGGLPFGERSPLEIVAFVTGALVVAALLTRSEGA